MKPSELTSHTEQSLHLLLTDEFQALNAAHFNGRLRQPEIVISQRKTYGGYYQPQRHRIVISWQAHLEHGLAETLNTFRHEVAHIVHPNHSASFWKLAIEVGVTKRYASAPLARTRRRYLYACPVCQRQIERRRRLKLASCARCDRAFNLRYLLRLVSSEVFETASVGTF